MPAPETILNSFPLKWATPIRSIIGRFFPGLLIPPPTPIQQPTGRSPPSLENDTLRVKQRDVVEATILQSFLTFMDNPKAVTFAHHLTPSLLQIPEVLPDFVDYFFKVCHQSPWTYLRPTRFLDPDQ